MPEEIIILVDKNDTIIGQCVRGDKKPHEIHRMSSLWVTNSQGDILLAQRHINKKNNPGKWSVAVGGTNAIGETYESNIYKEAEEEIGLTGVTFETRMKLDKSSSHNPLFCQFFSCVLDRDVDEFHIQEEEVQDLRWWNPGELRLALRETPEIFTKSMPLYFDLFQEK